MSGLPPVLDVHWTRTCRLVPSRYPTVGVFDRVADPADLPELFELEGSTNDRLSAELGLLHVIPRDEWIAGPMSSVVMAAFCHPSAGGTRFSDDTRGAWYAGRTLETALAEERSFAADETAALASARASPSSQKTFRWGSVSRYTTGSTPTWRMR